MLENRIIEQQIVAILKGSNLPMNRREQVAEELRGHFEQLLAAQSDKGLSEDQVIESAIADFGSPHVIRKQLCKQQRILDRQKIVARIRKNAKPLAVIAGLFTLLLLLKHIIHGTPPLVIAAGGISIFVYLCLFLSAAMYFFSPLESRLTRPRPLDEYNMAVSFTYWVGVVCFFIPLMAVISLLLLCVSGFPFMETPIYDLGNIKVMLNLCWYFVIVYLQALFTGMMLIPHLVLILAATLYERSRCVDAPGRPAVSD